MQSLLKKIEELDNSIKLKEEKMREGNAVELNMEGGGASSE